MPQRATRRAIKAALSIPQQVADLAVRFSLVRRLLPLLQETQTEFERVRRAYPYPSGPPINEIINHILSCTFDMLVIDTYSVREGMVKDRRGLLQRLKVDPSPLNRRPKPRPTGDWGKDHETELCERAYDAARERLLGDGAAETASVEQVVGMIKRLRGGTARLARARNLALAHRYEESTYRPGVWLPLPAVEAQILVVDRFVVDLYLVLSDASYRPDQMRFPGTKEATEDLADLLVHGGINMAVTAYHDLPTTPIWGGDRPLPWYWAKRKDKVG